MLVYLPGEWTLEQRKLIQEKGLDKYYDSEPYLIKKTCELYKVLMEDIEPNDIPICQSDYAKILLIALRNRSKPIDKLEQIVGRRDHEEIENLLIAFSNWISFDRWDSIKADKIHKIIQLRP